MKPDPLEIQNPELYDLFHRIVHKKINAQYYSGTLILNGQRKSVLKIGRNDPCFCGSEKKYKKCHGGINVKIKN